MGFTRRQFVKTSVMAGAGVMFARNIFGQIRAPRWTLRKFIAGLPGVGPAGIPVASPDTSTYPGTDFYRLVMRQYRFRFHPDLPASGTRLWGYADARAAVDSARYLGPAIVATQGRPVRIQLTNSLPSSHPLPIDPTLMGADGAVNRAAIHLHGGFVPWPSDGGPFHWSAPGATPGAGLSGESHLWWLPDRTGRLTDDLWYPNAQSARLMWYHDHAMGITRLNAYAGLAAPYVLIDQDELRMFGPRGRGTGQVLDNQVPGIPLVLQDKSFKAVADEFGGVGDLDYPTAYPDPVSGVLGAAQDLPVSCVPEFFSDNIVINGMAYPQLTLPAGVYRFRLLNGTQSRMFNLQMFPEDRANVGEPNLRGRAPDFIQIGTEGGFLPRPVLIPSNNKLRLEFDAVEGAVTAVDYLAHKKNAYGLLLGGAERADVLIDFSESAGHSFILCNDAPAPFPSGDPGNDYFLGGGRQNGADSGGVGLGPNTRTMMRITITPGNYRGVTMKSFPDLMQVLTAELLATSLRLGLLVPDLLIGNVFAVPPGVTRRIKTLNEGADGYGRLIQLLGTNAPGDPMSSGGTAYGMAYMDPLRPDEQPSVGSTEVWDVYNTTGDVHPIHFHLVNVQVIGRAPFAQDAAGNPVGGVFGRSGPWIAPDPNERGFKETVRMNPGEVTRVIMKFDLPPAPFVYDANNVKQRIDVPASPRTGGHEYVWHCHILEHEEHDMMRPLVVF